MKRKIALILPGGGLKGRFQHEAIDVLRRYGLDFDYIAGVSIGGIEGAFQATGQHREAGQFWRKIEEEGVGFVYTSDFLDLTSGQIKPNIDAIIRKLVPKLSLWDKIGLASKKNQRKLVGQILSNAKNIKGIADNTPLLNLLRKHITRDKIKGVYSAGAVSAYNGNYYAKGPQDFTDDENFLKFILASSNMPGVWPWVEEIRLASGETMRDMIDGGLRNISPLGDAVRYIESIDDDPDEWLFIIIPTGTGFIKPAEEEMNAFTVVVRALNDIALSEILQNDTEHFLQVNDLVKQCPGLKSRSGRPLRQFDTMIIQPEEDSLGGTLDASPVIMQKRAELGREKALKALEWAQNEKLL